MALDFPASPVNGQKYPEPPVAGVPVYTWDGEKWTTLGGAVGSTGGSDLVPLPDTAAGEAGSSTLWSRGDHAHPQDPVKVNKTGDTMTGALNFVYGSPRLDMFKSGSGQSCSMNVYTGVLPRWSIEFSDSSAESGTVTGSNIGINGYNNDGSFINRLFTFGRNGDFSTTGNIYATAGSGSFAHVQSSNEFNVTGMNASFSSNSAQTTLITNANCYVNYTKSTGQYVWVVNNTLNMSLNDSGGSGGILYVYNNGYKPGGGVWGDSSDARIKNVEGEYKAGLEEIAKLRPIVYTFKGNDTPDAPANIVLSADDLRAKEAVTVPYPNSPHYGAAKSGKRFRGLIAQEVQQVLPEMITKRPGQIDGNPVNDILDLDTTPLVYALVNAVKELKARVEALEGA